MEFVITTEDANQTLLKFVKKTYKHIPLSRIHALFRKKDIKVNNQRTGDSTLMLNTGDTVFVYSLSAPKHVNKFDKYEQTFDVVFENDEMLIVYKPPRLVVHAPRGVDSLDNQVLSYLYKKGDWDPTDSITFKPHHVHRIDKETSGLVIYAKTKKMLSWFAENINNKELIKKFYLASVNKKIEKPFEVTGFIRANHENTKMVIHPEGPGKEVSTLFRPLAFDGADTLLECQLLSGRKHQIRASLASVDAPIIGDKKYGSKIFGKLQLEAFKLVIKGKTYKMSKMYHVHNL